MRRDARNEARVKNPCYMMTIRAKYEEHGADKYYRESGKTYCNPHEPQLIAALDKALRRWSPNLENLLVRYLVQSIFAISISLTVPGLLIAQTSRDSTAPRSHYTDGVIGQFDESAIEAVIGVTIKAGVNACAVGGKGIGKTTTFEKIAEKAGAKIAVISCSPDGIRPDLFGTLISVESITAFLRDAGTLAD